MSTEEVLNDTTLIYGESLHDDFVHCSIQQLQHLIWVAVTMDDTPNDELILLCIHKQSFFWSDILEMLSEVNQEETPQSESADCTDITFKCAVVYNDTCDVLVEKVPIISDIIKPVKEGTLRTFVLSDLGCSVYYITPSPLN